MAMSVFNDRFRFSRQRPPFLWAPLSPRNEALRQRVKRALFIGGPFDRRLLLVSTPPELELRVDVPSAGTAVDAARVKIGPRRVAIYRFDAGHPSGPAYLFQCEESQPPDEVENSDSP
jgi:hypothetical protein